MLRGNVRDSNNPEIAVYYSTDFLFGLIDSDAGSVALNKGKG